MFMLCEAMKWSHLPVAGGIYDQDPDLLDGFLIIFHERSEHDAKEAEKNRPKGNSRIRGASRPR
jgi:hypothetical protein